MIRGFETETAPLTDQEERILSGILNSLSKRKGKKNAITNKQIRDKIREHWDIDIGGPRIRKIINQIRVRELIPRLIASSKGYYVEDNISELDTYIKSLDERIGAIAQVRDTLKKQRDQLKFKFKT